MGWKALCFPVSKSVLMPPNCKPHLLCQSRVHHIMQLKVRDSHGRNPCGLWPPKPGVLRLYSMFPGSEFVPLLQHVHPLALGTPVLAHAAAWHARDAESVQ